MQTKYATARTVMWFVGFMGWVAFAAGLIVLAMGAVNESDTAALGVGIGIAIAVAGLIEVAMAQVSVAILDMADNSREALAMQHAIARNDILPQTTASTHGTTTPAPNSTIDQPSEEQKSVTIYMDQEIEKKDSRYYWKGQKFLTLGKAKAAIKSAMG